MKMKKTINLIIPENIDNDTIARKVERSLDLKNIKVMSYHDSCILTTEDKSGNFLEIDVSHVEMTGYEFTNIRLEFECNEDGIGSVNRDKLIKILKEFNGILVIKEYEKVGIYKLKNVVHGINYPSDSCEVELMKEVMNITQNPFEASIFARIVLDKRDIIEDFYSKVDKLK